MKKMIWLTHLLWIFGMICGIAAVLVLFYPQELDSADALISAVDSDEKSAEPLVRNWGPFDTYEEVFSERDIFETSTRFSGMPGEEGGRADEDFRPFVDLAEKYQVVGIVVDQHPQAALKDKKTNETVFLSIGDQLDGAVIDQIMAGRIILRLNGQTMELKP